MHAKMLLQPFLWLGLASIRRAYQAPAQQPLNLDITSKKLNLTHDLIGLHQALVQIESISGNEKEVGEWLASSLESQGYHVEKQVVEKDPLRFNVCARSINVQ